MKTEDLPRDHIRPNPPQKCCGIRQISQGLPFTKRRYFRWGISRKLLEIKMRKETKQFSVTFRTISTDRYF